MPPKKSKRPKPCDLRPKNPGPAGDSETTTTTQDDIDNQNYDKNGGGDTAEQQKTQEFCSSESESESESIISASLNLGQKVETKLSPAKVLNDSSSSFTTANSSSSSVSIHSAPPDISINFEGKEDVPIIEEQLPTTTTTLTHINTKIYLIGTAHFSLQSQEDVRKVIGMTRPDCILLELCISRRNILQYDEETLLREAGDVSFGKIMQTLKQSNGSKVQSLLHLLLLSMSASLTKKLGMAPGGEFRAAVKAAEELDNIPTILLGDRPFNVTMQRAIHSLSLKQKIKLFFQFLSSNTDDITKEEIEKCKEKDLLEQMLSEMTGEYPSITQVFVEERDTYLAHTLLQTSQSIQKPNPVIVAVVGMGHVPGIVKQFGNTTEEEYLRVSSLPPVTPQSTPVWLLKSAIKISFYAGLGYGAYKVFNRFDLFKKFDFGGFRLGVVKVE